LYVDFYLSRPKAHRGAKGLKPSAPHHHTTKPDTTKLLRCLEDALTNVIWRDDTQVVRQHVSKNYGDPERTEVRIVRVDV
jgi:Holliday junction resolvase RusA-like endonuclease